MPTAGAQRHLNSRGDNLANYVQFLEKEEPARFKRVLSDVSKKIPGIEYHAQAIRGWASSFAVQ